MSKIPTGFQDALRYSLFEAIFNRRSRRVMKGIQEVRAGSLTYRSEQKPEPLTELEEAVLIAAIGLTGDTMPDRPYQDPQGRNILGTPNLNMAGRAAGSPDNAQATYFFLINDSGTYFLRRLPPGVSGPPNTPEEFISRAAQCKVKLFDRRLDFPRAFPFYLDSNRFLSNLPGSTVLVPVVEMTQQYINALMYLLTEEEGRRPMFVDDRNFYLPAVPRKWRRSFVNRDIKIPLGILGPMRTQIEADLLLQNVMLAVQAMGLGGWIHASPGPPYLLGSPHAPNYKPGMGLGFDFQVPPFRLLDIIRWGTFIPKLRANPTGLRHPETKEWLIRCLTPPNVQDMAAAVDEVVAAKFARDGIYNDAAYFSRIMRGDGGERYRHEVPRYHDDVIACVKDICTCIYERHGRFPAHVDAVHVPGIWMQVHHLDLKYYDELFTNGYTETQRRHHEQWHAGS
jgi:hypothetical protein